MRGKVLVALSLFGAGSVATVSAQTLEQALSTCSQKSNSLQRLVCYDKVVKDLNQYEGLDKSLRRDPVKRDSVASAPRSQPQQQAERSSQPQAESDFGLEHKQDVSDKADSMAATVEGIRETVAGKKIFTLSDGTVWQQTDSTRLKITNGQRVTVERGWLGAFYLSREDVNTRIKVKRTQ